MNLSILIHLHNDRAALGLCQPLPADSTVWTGLTVSLTSAGTCYTCRDCGTSTGCG